MIEPQLVEADPTGRFEAAVRASGWPAANVRPVRRSRGLLVVVLAVIVLALVGAGIIGFISLRSAGGTGKGVRSAPADDGAAASATGEAVDTARRRAVTGLTRACQGAGLRGAAAAGA